MNRVRLQWVAIGLIVTTTAGGFLAVTITASAAPQSLSAPPGYSTSELRFNFTASGSASNPIDWDSFLSSGGSQGEAWNSNGKGGSSPANCPDYDAEYDLPDHVSESNGIIDIRATKTGTEGILGETPTVYPFASGVLCSYGKFEFSGGYVQIEAKMPGGSGLWPGLWMLPGAGAKGTDSYEIDLFEGGAKAEGPGSSSAEMYSWHLHTPYGTFDAYSNSDVNLTAGFNTYGLRWIPRRSITWYLDGRVRRLQSGRYQATYLQDGERHYAPETFSTKAEANAYLSGIETDVRGGRWIDPRAANTLFGDYAQIWRTSQIHRPSTSAQLETNLRRHVLPSFESRPLVSIRLLKSSSGCDD